MADTETTVDVAPLTGKLLNFRLEKQTRGYHSAALHTVIAQCTSTTVGVNIGLLAAQNSKTTTDTLDAGQCIGNLNLPINVGVQHTQNVLEVVRLQYESL